MPRKTKPPTYRKRQLPQGDRAYLTLRDRETGKSKDYNLGPYGSGESRERYAQLIAEWEANHRRLPSSSARSNAAQDGVTAAQLCLAYWEAVGQHYSKGEAMSIKLALRVLLEHYRSTDVSEIGPNALRLVRQSMVTGKPDGEHPRKPWARTYINSQMRRLRRVFKWGTTHETISPTAYQVISTLEPLKRGRTPARETDPVRPVPEARVRAVCERVSRQVAAMIDLQLLTGMRPGEVCSMRPCDIDMSGRVWLYAPEQHKTVYCDRSRTIYLRPQAQEVIRPFLTGCATTVPVFSAAVADRERREEQHRQRKTPLSCGNRPGTNRRDAPKRSPGAAYTIHSYRRAIARASDQAFPPAAPLAKRDDETHAEHTDRLTPVQLEKLRAWQKSNRWHPHQLRHNYATEIRPDQRPRYYEFPHPRAGQFYVFDVDRLCAGGRLASVGKPGRQPHGLRHEGPHSQKTDSRGRHQNSCMEYIATTQNKPAWRWFDSICRWLRQFQAVEHLVDR